MFRRVFVYLAVLIVLCGLHAFVSPARADCEPPNGAGTDSNDAVICDGDDLDGVNVGSGQDSVDIITGTVFSTIASEGGALNIVIFGALDTIAMGTDAISSTGPLDLILLGNVNSGGDVVVIRGNGSIISAGTHYSTFGSGLIILRDGDNATGHIKSIGNIKVYGLFSPDFYHSYGYGLSVDQGTIDSIGDIFSLRSAAIHLEDGSVTSVGNLHAASFGVVIESGSIVSIGNVEIDDDRPRDTAGFRIYADGDLTTTGNISGGYYGIHVGGHATVISIGNITSRSRGIYMEKTSDVTTTGDITSNETAIHFEGDGSVTSVGNLTGFTGYGILIKGIGYVDSVGNVHGDLIAIELGGGGEVHSEGTIESRQTGIFINGDGLVESKGSIENTETGIYVAGNGKVVSDGSIDTSDQGIYVAGEADVQTTGLVSGDNVGIKVGSGSVKTVGTVTSDHVAIDVGGDASISTEGRVTAGEVAIQGDAGEQDVQVRGLVDAPIAVRLGAGNDSLYIHEDTTVNGAIEMGAGDDSVLIGNRAVVVETVLGGEDESEVVGDSIYIGDGQVCSEDPVAVANAEAISGLDPNGDTVNYLGQDYTWEEFEHIATGSVIEPCIGQIADGRANSNDLAAPDAVYCTVGGGVSVWDIDPQGQGTFTFAVTQEQIAAAFAQATGESHVLIGSDNLGNALYALGDGHTLAFIGPDLHDPAKMYQHTFEKNLCSG